MSTKIDQIQQAIGRIETELMRIKSNQYEIRNFSSIGFKVYSQNDEDGIIQYLISKINIKNEIFIEFGVENYTEANTRFLLLNNNWNGLIIDSDQKNIDSIKKDSLFGQRNLKVDCSFITVDNINTIINSHEIQGEIGLLSIDIDGNDFWVWESINVINPNIVIVEFNNLFGPEAQITIPYSPLFDRTEAHFSWLYFGASLNALYHLGLQKGYSLVGVNNICNNAFFVRDDLIGSLPIYEPKALWKPIPAKESRNQAGELSFLSPHEGLKLIEDMPVYDLTKQKNVKIKDLTIRLT